MPLQFDFPQRKERREQLFEQPGVYEDVPLWQRIAQRLGVYSPESAMMGGPMGVFGRAREAVPGIKALTRWTQKAARTEVPPSRGGVRLKQIEPIAPSETYAGEYNVGTGQLGLKPRSVHGGLRRHITRLVEEGHGKEVKYRGIDAFRESYGTPKGKLASETTSPARALQAMGKEHPGYDEAVRTSLHDLSTYVLNYRNKLPYRWPSVGDLAEELKTSSIGDPETLKIGKTLLEGAVERAKEFEQLWNRYPNADPQALLRALEPYVRPYTVR